MASCNDCTRKGCKNGACVNMNKFEQKPVPYKYAGTCPRCGSWNRVWEERENTVQGDVVYCWHCGLKVQLK